MNRDLMPTEPHPTSGDRRGAVVVRDVSLRDGLQDAAPIPTEAKVALFEALVAAGVDELELTSFVRADLIPALADAEALVSATDALAAAADVIRWGLVLNARGAERALAAGLTHLQYVVSVSEAHNRANAGRSVDESFAALAAVRELAPQATLEVTLSTAFGCPFTGAIPPADVAAAVAHAVECGVDGIALADTIGTAAPSEVRTAVAAAVAVTDVPIGAHLHDTRGLAIANALAALDAGAVRLDAAVGGLGGCPFAPGASGNVPIEDLTHALHAEGWTTGLDVDALVAAAHLACAATGRAVDSHIGRAGQRFATLADGRG